MKEPNCVKTDVQKLMARALRGPARGSRGGGGGSGAAGTGTLATSLAEGKAAKVVREHGPCPAGATKRPAPPGRCLCDLEDAGRAFLRPGLGSGPGAGAGGRRGRGEGARGRRVSLPPSCARTAADLQNRLRGDRAPAAALIRAAGRPGRPHAPDRTRRAPRRSAPGAVRCHLGSGEAVGGSMWRRERVGAGLRPGLPGEARTGRLLRAHRGDVVSPSLHGPLGTARREQHGPGGGGTGGSPPTSPRSPLKDQRYWSHLRIGEATRPVCRRSGATPQASGLPGHRGPCLGGATLSLHTVAHPSWKSLLLKTRSQAPRMRGAHGARRGLVVWTQAGIWLPRVLGGPRALSREQPSSPPFPPTAGTQGHPSAYREPSTGSVPEKPPLPVPTA